MNAQKSINYFIDSPYARVSAKISILEFVSFRSFIHSIYLLTSAPSDKQNAGGSTILSISKWIGAGIRRITAVFTVSHVISLRRHNRLFCCVSFRLDFGNDRLTYHEKARQQYMLGGNLFFLCFFFWHNFECVLCVPLQRVLRLRMCAIV